MSQPTPQVLQTYTLLQIAAETFLGTTKPEDPAARPGDAPPLLLGFEMLKTGNRRSTRMTDQQARDFEANWKVVSHQPNTATGLSATLFEYIGPADKQPTSSKFVVSFRSTEFIEDHVRDSIVTNEMEIKQSGWALGQLADMRTWWNSVQSKLNGAQVDVTGYSLGGHLATAFNELYSSRVRSYYTFNGAGVGRKETPEQLHALLDQFSARRNDGANADLFTVAAVRSLYTNLQTRFNGMQGDGTQNARQRHRRSSPAALRAGSQWLVQRAANAGRYCHAA